MRVLVLGGTLFVGRHVVELLLARGHDVTIFHRGQRGRELFPDVKRVLGDRKTDLDRLPAGATWDVVLDTCTSLPGYVATSVRALRERTQRYVYISSISVYDAARPTVDESTPTVELAPGASRDEVTGENFGALKVLCEREVLDAFGTDRALIVRPGLIVGPYDQTDRFTYWPLRFARGGDVAVPDDLDAPVQWIDVRDLAEFIADALERRLTGVVNTVGPAAPATLRTLLDACAGASGVASRIVPIGLTTLKKHGIEEWSDLPVWAGRDATTEGLTSVDPTRAIELGLHHRPLHETVVDTLRWAQRQRGDAPLKAGLTPEREAELLAVAVDNV
ncbi:MAG: isoflavone reductase [Candidatus Eremiobacteraeota bacterium]|nr:isoflavone reductase [Candidatus Eremiobacteraeota bacterium]